MARLANIAASGRDCAEHSHASRKVTLGGANSAILLLQCNITIATFRCASIGSRRPGAGVPPFHKASQMLKGKNAVVTGSTSGIGLGIARAFAKDGANVVINGFGAADDIEKERAGIEKEFGVKAIYSPRRHDQARRDRRDDQDRGNAARLLRRAGQQRRHPARRADRGIPDREVGPDHRDQPVVRVPCHPRRGARHEGAQVGPHHLDRVGAFAGRLAVQGRLRLGQARPRRLDQDGGARACDLRHHGATASRRATSGRRWWRSRSPTR